MATYQQGDIVNRFGTVGVSRVAENGLFVVIAVNNEDRFGNGQLYTCAPIWSGSSARTGFVPAETVGGAQITIDLSRTLVAGEGCIVPSKPGTNALKTMLSEKGLRALREGLKNKFHIDGADVGRVVTTVSPEDGGGRGKVNRPYAIVASLGKGSGEYLAVPISSSRGALDSGKAIKDLKAAGLEREEGQASFLRFGLLQSINIRTSTLTKGRLGQEDRTALVVAAKSIRDELVGGVVSKRVEEPSTCGTLERGRGVGCTTGKRMEIGR